jgi:hypothetical protein
LLSLAPDFAADAIATLKPFMQKRDAVQKHFGSPAVPCVAISFLKIPSRRCGANVSMSAQRLSKR